MAEQEHKQPPCLLCCPKVLVVFQLSDPAKKTLVGGLKRCLRGFFLGHGLGVVFFAGLPSKAHLRERATLAPRKGPFRHTDASREGVGPQAGVLAPKPRASKQARERERPYGPGGVTSPLGPEGRRERERLRMFDGLRDPRSPPLNKTFGGGAGQRPEGRQR